MTKDLEKLKRFGKTLTVLYVEDDITLQKETKVFLLKFFKKVITADNGAKALERFKEQDFHLIVADVKMPVMDGLTMCQEIRKLNKKIPIIVTTAFDEKEFLFKALEIGVTNYLLKPIEHKIFILTLVKTLKENFLEKRVEELNALLKNIINYQKNMLVVVKETKIVLANRQFLEFFSLHSLHEAQIRQKSLGLSFIQEDGFFYPEHPLEWINEMTKLKSCKVKIYSNKEKEEIVCMVEITPLPSKECLISLADVTKILKEDKKIQDDASMDPLTNTYNGYKFTELVESFIKHYDLKDDGTIIFIRVDNYKYLKEIYGYKEANGYLKKLSDVLRFAITPDIVLSRFDDKSFALLNEQSLFESLELIQKIKKLLAEDTTINQEVRLSFSGTKIGKNDSVSSLISKSDKYLYLAKESVENDTITDADSETTFETSGESKDILRLLKGAMTKRNPIKVFNLYKGLSVSSEGQIDFVGEDSVGVILGKSQLLALEYEKEGYIYSTNFSSVIKAKVEKIDWSHHRCFFSLFKRAPTSPVHRKCIRVIPRSATPVTLLYDNETIQGNILDISKNSLAIKITGDATLPKEQEIELLFSLVAGVRDIAMSVHGKLKLMIENPNWKKVVIDLYPDRESEKKLSIYITTRQMEIVREFKKKSEQ